MKIPKPGLFAFAALMTACSHHEEVKVAVAPTAAFTWSDGVDRMIFDGTSSESKNGSHLTYGWTFSTTGLSPKGTETAGISTVRLPKNFSEAPVDVKLTVNNGSSTSTLTQSVPFPAYSTIRAYGLGQELLSEKSNNGTTEWYRDQGNSGAYSSINCGPASVTMAVRWTKPGFSKTVEDARNTYRSSGGWWFTDDVIKYLNDYKAPNYIVDLSSPQDLKTIIDEGKIIILCLDMYYVSPETDPAYRFNKFYIANTTGWGHFLVVKGYKNVRKTLDGAVTEEMMMEVYDPYSLSTTYDDGQLKGKNRYYSDRDLFYASRNWWPYMIVVGNDTGNGGTGGRRGYAIADLPVQSGR